MENLSVRMDLLAAKSTKRTPKVPYRSYAECEAKGYADGYAAASRDAVIVGVAMLCIMIAGMIFS